MSMESVKKIVRDIANTFTEPEDDPSRRMEKGVEMVFVFGSNLAGVHGAGAAQAALKFHKAEWGVGSGRTGESYAIPTKDHDIRTLPISTIKHYVIEFIKYAQENPAETFHVTQIGCGLAGFKAEEIAPLFVDAPPNCFFDSAWEPYLPGKNFWGTFHN